jgi:hypothetical protein
MTKLSVAVMQPYFFPYPAYYRLLLMADVFVILDTAQFPRRGRVHRCELKKMNSDVDWLTLPLVKAKVNTEISSIELRPDWANDVRTQLNRFPLASEQVELNEQVYNSIFQTSQSNLSEILENQIKTVDSIINFDVEIIKASSINIDPNKVGEERILEIISAVKGKRYINSPGGISLYKEQNFRRNGIELHFLPETKLGLTSILEYLQLFKHLEIRKLIHNDSK